MVTRGFTGRGSSGDQSDRIPPGQHLVENFPVLTAGPTPSVEPSDWKFTVKIGPKPVKVWNWSEFNALPKTKMTRDIHCVTSWSKPVSYTHLDVYKRQHLRDQKTSVILSFRSV